MSSFSISLRLISHPLGEDFNGVLEYIPTKYDRKTILDAIEKVPKERPRQKKGSCVKKNERSDFYNEARPGTVRSSILG